MVVGILMQLWNSGVASVNCCVALELHCSTLKELSLKSVP